MKPSNSNLPKLDCDWAVQSNRSTLVVEEIPLSPTEKETFTITYSPIDKPSRDVEVCQSIDSTLSEKEVKHDEKKGIDWGAVKFMCGAMAVEAIVWGFTPVFGIFQRYYETSPQFENKNLIPIIGTVTLGVTSIPFIVPLMTAFPEHRQHMIWAGLAICALALVGSSFSTQVWHLILTQGVLYALGVILVYFPMLGLFNEWFIKRRGLAYGILSAAGGSTGLGLPFLLDWSLKRWGFATTLRAYSIAIVILVGPATFLMRSNPAISERRKSTTKVNFSVFRTPKFAILAWSNFFQSLVFWLPSIYLPSYAVTLGLTPTQGTLVLCLFNIASVLGQFAIGYVSDHAELPVPVFISTAVASISAFTLWYLGHNLVVLTAFAIVYGLFAGGYSVFYGRFMTAISDDLDTGMWLLGFFDLERGLGVILAGPISSALVTMGRKVHGDTAEAYRGVILLVGVGMAVSCVSALGWLFMKKEARRDSMKRGSVTVRQSPV